MKRLKRGRLFSLFALAVLALGVAVPGAGQPAYAQAEGGVTLTARDGFDGFCKEDAWVPLRVTVQNNGPDIQGRVQVVYKLRANPAQAVLGQDLLIPGASRKEITFYAYPPAGSYSLDISLIVGGKSVVATRITRSCLVAENMLFGILADTPGLYDDLRDVPLVRGRSAVAHLRVADLPDRAQGWTALDGLLVSNIDTSALTEAQRQALQTWLANGGKLMVIGGPQWQGAAAGLRDMLPVDIASTENVADLSALSTYFQAGALEGTAIVARSTPRAGASVLVEQAGVPLIVEKPVGFGKVIFVALDPALEPLSKWAGVRSIYSQLLGVHAVRPGWTAMPWAADAANRALSTLPELSLPSSGYLCGWLALYILVIGPLNFIILRRRKRGEWAWFTVPALVVLFTAGSYVYGGIYRGNQPILNRLAVVQAWEGVDQAQVRAQVGVYSPGRATYTVEAAQPFLLYASETNSSSSTLQDGQAVSMPDVRVEIGGMKALTVIGSVKALPISHNLKLVLGDSSPALGGTLTNNSSYTLRDAMLVTSGDWQELGDLAPGAPARVNVSLSPSSSGPAFYSLDAESILHMNPFPLGPSVGGGQASAEQARRLGLLQAVLQTRSQGNWGIFLMGWTDRPMAPVSVRGRAFKAVDTSLYVEQLSPLVEYGNGPWQLSPGVMAWESSDPQRAPFSSISYGYGSTDYVLSFRPAVPVPYTRVKTLTLEMGSANSGPMAGQVDVSLWDFESAAWAKQGSLSWGSNSIADPARHVGPGGEVRLRIETNNNSYIGISQSTVTLVVDK